jgi:hypothetical protein
MNLTYFFKRTIPFGIIAGVLTSVYCLVLYGLDILPLDGKKAPSLVLHLVMMIVGVWQYRKGQKDEILHFWEGLLVSNFINLVGACVSAAFLYFLLQYDPQILPRYIQETLQALALPNIKNQFLQEMGEPAYQSILAQFKVLKISDIARDEIWGVKGKIPLGFFASVMISLYFRRQYVRAY